MGCDSRAITYQDSFISRQHWKTQNLCGRTREWMFWFCLKTSPVVLMWKSITGKMGPITVVELWKGESLHNRFHILYIFLHRQMNSVLAWVGLFPCRTTRGPSCEQPPASLCCSSVLSWSESLRMEMQWHIKVNDLIWSVLCTARSLAEWLRSRADMEKKNLTGIKDE